MGFRQWLSPSFLFAQLHTIDLAAEADRDLATSKNEADERVVIWKIIALACLCLLLVHYGKYSANLRDFITLLDSTFGAEGAWTRAFRLSEYRELYGYVWWGSVNLLGFLIIPMMAIRFWMKQPLRDFGWQWGEVHYHWRGYVLLSLPIMVFAIIASFGDDFSKHYPFYNQSSRSWFDLLSWEVIYILQFVAVEFFFRGYLVNGLKKQFGSLSIAIMCLPYLMLHFPKLWPESFGAILFGFFLGVLALMSRSIWGGVAVHVSIALTMDIAAMVQTGGLPKHW